MHIELTDTYRDTDLGSETETLLGPCVQCG